MKSEIINEKTSIPLNSHSRISLDERVRFLKSLKNEIKLNEEYIYEALDPVSYTHLTLPTILLV